MHYDSYLQNDVSCSVALCEGDIVAGDFDESNVTGDHGTWHTHLGRSFLQSGNLGSGQV